MMKTVLKSLAISFGGGLALGAGIKIGQGSAKRGGPAVDLNPLLNRLDNVENRMLQMESTVLPEAAEAGETSAAHLLDHTTRAFESRLAAQFTAVDNLRNEILAVDRRSADQLAQLTKKLSELESSLPMLIETRVGSRVGELEIKLQKNLQDAHGRSMEAFVETIQNTVVQRISNLESNLVEQSNAIGGLRDASLKTDQNLQKMLLGIEKLCDQKSQTTSYPPEPPQPRKYSPMPEVPAEGPEPRREEAVAPERARPVSPEPVPRAIADDYPGGEPAKREERPDNPHSARFAEPATTTVATEEPRDAGGLYTRLDPIALRLLKPEVPERNKWRVPVIVGLFLLSAGMWALYWWGALQKRPARAAANPGQVRGLASRTGENASSRSGELRSIETRAAADPSSEALQLELGREYVNRKDWARAENAYRSVLRVNPRNREAVLALSDVLYQQQKYEESASVLSKLSSGRNP